MRDYERLTKEDLEILNDLYERLVLDYAGDKQFEQLEEDRLVIGRFIDKIESGKLIELPLIVKTKSGWYVVWIENFITTDTNALQGDFCADKFTTKEAAEAKLAELKKC